MKLSIITINYNNANGLSKTMKSVLSQTFKDFEYIVIDGLSTDGSKEIIKGFENQFNDLQLRSLKWISETDSGIYNAMNKGIKMAQGEYIQFLNSGDILVSPEVTGRMTKKLTDCDILYGNMLKPYRGRIIHDRGFSGRLPTMLDFYSGTLNHSSAYIRRSLFDTFGLYDESLKIVSDWKWYLQVIGMNRITPVYINIDVTVFDMKGISNTNSALDKAERRKVLEELLPLSVLHDYDKYTFPIDQLKRINHYWLTRKCFWFIERILFKLEKLVGNKE